MRIDPVRRALVKRPPTDFEILREIYARHRDEFAANVVARSSKILLPIDVPAIAASFQTDNDVIFGRLYYHLDRKYGEPEQDGKPRKAFFTPVAGSDRNCVNFPLLEAILAGLWQERRRDGLAIATSVVSLSIAIASLIVAIIAG